MVSKNRCNFMSEVSKNESLSPDVLNLNEWSYFFEKTHFMIGFWWSTKFYSSLTQENQGKCLVAWKTKTITLSTNRYAEKWFQFLRKYSGISFPVSVCIKVTMFWRKLSFHS